MKALIYIIVWIPLATACARPDYPDLRQIFVDAGKMLDDYHGALQRAQTAADAVKVMKAYNAQVEQFIAKSSEIRARYPEFRDIANLRQACDRMEEFQSFRRTFREFYRAGDGIARKFAKDQAFQAESRRGRRLILQML